MYFQRSVRLGHRQTPASALPLLQQQIVETGLHDLINAVWRPKVFAKRGALPCNSAGFGHDGQLKRREIADAHKLRARLDSLGNCRKGQRGQKPCEPIAAACDHGHIGATGRRPADGRQAPGVVTRKTQMASQGVSIHLHLMAERTQVLEPALESRFVAHRARRRKNVDVAHKR